MSFIPQRDFFTYTKMVLYYTVYLQEVPILFYRQDYIHLQNNNSACNMCLHEPPEKYKKHTSIKLQGTSTTFT